MRLPATTFILLTCMFSAIANPAEEAKRRVLEKRHLVKMDMSKASQEQFSMFMNLLCITVKDMPITEYYTSYILWEEVEFLEGVKDLLDPTSAFEDRRSSLYHHLGHNFASNCSLKDDNNVRDAHVVVEDHTKFDNYMYDQMTRKEWTSLHL
ncbi:uncharacterized protein CELE_C09H10.5 [Caenorhabditis elegans]|nr:Secreted protein [Caenorhabditis elegans]CAA90437.3 Secreted protein [Caenorhabditis elegans]|eukprot:NP_001254276.1 Uncharacterized protein CELE_C09H10.5 [Caenorhabditis elegans]